jgi:sugar lactone lactonase YvrE
MKMNITPTPIAGTFQQWARVARRIVAVGALAVGISSASAQIAISTLAGTNASITTGSTDATGILARFNVPIGVVTDGTNLYVADSANHTIRKIVISSGAVTTFAGAALTPGITDTGTGPATLARFNTPSGIAIDGAGNLWVADTGNQTIRKIVISTGVVSTVAGTAGTFGYVNNTGILAKFFNPSGIATDRAGGVVGGAAVNIFVSDTSNNVIRQIVVATGAVSTLAGGGGAAPTNTPGNATGTGTAALLTAPNGIAVDFAGANVYVADTSNHLIRKITVPGGVVTTFAGSTLGSSDGTGIGASFNNPYGIALDNAAANLYVADTSNQTIRKITVPGQVVTTIAGTAPLGGSVNAVGALARFNGPRGIAVDSSSNIYVADTVNQIIRNGGPAALPAIGGGGQPANVTVTAPAVASFTVTATGNPTPTYQWQISPAVAHDGYTTGSFQNVNNTGAYSGATTSTLSISTTSGTMTGDKFQVVVTNSQGTTTSNGLATLTANQAPVFTNLNGTTPTFAINVLGSFTVTASGSPAPTFSVTSGTFPPFASLNGTTGAITGTPVSAGGPYTFVITATGSGAPATQSFTVTVTNGAVVSTPPVAQNIALGNPATFSVGASGTPASFTYQWQRQAALTFGFVNLSDIFPYSGSATASLSIAATSLAMSGDQFQVVVSNGIGSPVTSTPVALSVIQAPVFTSAASTTFAITTASSFTVAASGSPAPTFSVTAGTFPSWASLNGTTGALTGTPPDLTGSPFSFTLTATSTGSAPVSQAFILTVSPTPLTPNFTTQPVNVSVSIGQPATYTVVAGGTPVPTYQWQRQANNTLGFVNLVESATYVGTVTATLIVNNTTTGMSGDQFLAVATNTIGATSSTAATLTVTTGTVISTLAGKATLSGTADGTGTNAQFNNPFSVAVDLSGNIYVADTSNHTIRKVTTGGVVTTFAGQAGVSGSTDGTGSAARFFGPSGVAVDAAGDVYVADQFNHTIRVITPAGVVTTVAGAAGVNGFTDGTVANARFSFPSGVAVDGFGSVYVADTNNQTIRRFTINGFVSTMAGLAATTGTADGTGTAARFNSPSSVAVDASGNVYVADTSNDTIRKITQAGVVTTLAGGAGLAGTLDGTGVAARFSRPSGVAVDSLANVYVADTFNSTIRKITSAGVVTTLAGLGGASGTTDAIGSAARFSQPRGIAVDSAGNIYIADTGNHTIRRSGTVTAPQIQTQPLSTSIAPGGNATFTVVTTGAPTPTLFQWQRQPAGTTGFVNLTEGAPYTGTNTATLTVTGVTAAMQGDQFQVTVGNLISPDALSSAVTLNAVVAAPVFTSGTSATVQATTTLSVTIAATGNPTPTFSSTALPSWLTFNGTTGALAGTPPDTTGSPITITFTASNGISVNQTFILTVTPAVVAPSITTAPVGVAVNQGQSTTLSVTASGTTPLSYQWSHNGASINGATSATVTLSNVQPADAGTYTVTVSNVAGSVVSTGAQLIVNTTPAFTSQPRTQVALAGSAVTFSVSASGGASFNYQWRKNGVAILGATSSILTLNAVTVADAGNYDVIVSNGLGIVNSSLAQLTVVASATAPVVTAQPAAKIALAGTSVTLSVSASGAPAPTYQWRKNGVAISGANGSTYVLNAVASGDAANYDVVVSNSAGSVLSAVGSLRVIAHNYAGIYFGSFAGGLGNFAIYIRADNTGVFLGYLPGATVAVTNLNVFVNDAGQFSFTQGATTAATTAANDSEPARAAALASVSLNFTIAFDGSVSGSIAGGANATLSASRAADTGTTQTIAGFYQAGSSNSGATALTIASATGQAFVVAQTGTTVDGGSGTITTGGQIVVSTSRSTVIETVVPSTGAITGSSTGAVSASFSGASETVLATQRLGNISTRARVGSGSAVVIAGFIISGTESKPVLIRAIGPTLTIFGVPTAITAPKLDLYRGSAVIATNTGWANAGNTPAIVAASSQAGAFQLSPTSADSVIFTTLAPGAYTAIVSSANGSQGVALVEVYDLSAAATGQKLFNISTLATAGGGDNTLIAGFVVYGSVPKRVLIRAVGPGLLQLGLSGVLAQPQLVLIKDNVTVAQNTGWGTSPDATAIAAVAVQVGAFPLVAGSGDSALIVSLAPGSYSAMVVAPNGTSGTAIVEVYELP